MGHRLSRIYTRTGDTGTTGLGDGQRVPKDSTRVRLLGALDETNAWIGLLLTHTLPEVLRQELVAIQHMLFDLGAEMCLPGHAAILDGDITWLEERLDQHNATLPPLKEFILPGGNPAAAHCHLARTSARRAECLMVAVSREAAVRPQALAFINRLSDLLFVLARVLSRTDDGQEVLWQPALRAR